MKITAESLQTGMSPEELEELNKKSKKEKKPKKEKLPKKEKPPKKERRLFGKHKTDETDDDGTDAANDVDIDATTSEDDDQGGFIDDEGAPVKQPKSYKKIVIIASCAVLLMGVAGMGTYALFSSMSSSSLGSGQSPSQTTLSKEEQALLNSDNFDKDNEKRKGDTDVEVDVPENSLSDAERIVKLQEEVDRLKSELETAQNASTKTETTETPSKEQPSTTPAVSESTTVSDLKKQVSDLQGALSASEARESYLQNQLNAVKNTNSK